MRSLYTEDIQGTKPRLTIHDKSYYLQQHLLQTRLNPKPADRTANMHQWFVPLPKPPKHENGQEYRRNTLKLISEHTGISRSMHYQSLKKQKDSQDYSHRRNHSMLSQSGISTLSQHKVMAQINNPYYPHRIRQETDKSRSKMFTGNRHWNEEPCPQIKIPSVQKQYFSRRIII